MKKKDYIKPEMEIIALQNNMQLLAGSNQLTMNFGNDEVYVTDNDEAW